MPRDKTESHKRVLKAAREEFLEYGFSEASIRRIGEKAGLSSAGLYRHAKDKEELFALVVEDGINGINNWMNFHREQKQAMMASLKENEDKNQLYQIRNIFKDSAVDLVCNVIYKYREEFFLIFSKSTGTRYEHYLDDLVSASQKEMHNIFTMLKEHGLPAIDISETEIHILVSSYMTALLAPLINQLPADETSHCIELVENFYLNGWKSLMGIEK